MRVHSINTYQATDLYTTFNDTLLKCGMWAKRERIDAVGKKFISQGEIRDGV